MLMHIPHMEHLENGTHLGVIIIIIIIITIVVIITSLGMENDIKFVSARRETISARAPNVSCRFCNVCWCIEVRLIRKLNGTGLKKNFSQRSQSPNPSRNCTSR